MKFTSIFLFLALFISFQSTQAKEQGVELSTEQISTFLYKIEADIKDQRFLLENLDDYLQKLPNYTSWAEECVVTTNSGLDDHKSLLVKPGFQ
jgi:hypothetical protein